MTELLTGAQMRAVEAAAIASGEVTGLELMERAGRGVVEAILAEWPELGLTSHRAVVLCGPGNNGGDGFVVARVLQERGWDVEVFLYGDEAKLPDSARVNCERWREMGEVGNLASVAMVPRYGCDLVVDALFGTGLTRPLQGVAHDYADQCMHWHGFFSRSKVVAVDVPSGLCGDSGKRLDPEGFGFRADLTVTFHRPKIGHFLNWITGVCGKVVTADIGMLERHYPYEDAAFADGWCHLTRIDEGTVFELKKENYYHKFAYGHALILSGPSGRGGAARLAARGALRIGAGLVTLGCSQAALVENAGRVDAVMLRQVGDAAALVAVLKDDRINALCLGPGLGVSDNTRELVWAALAAKRETVLDADALTVLAGDPVLFGQLHENCVLTPHAGEFARLFPDIAAKLGAPATKGPAYSKVDATREAAKRAGCVVLFKGADTVIAEPSGSCAINSAHYERSAPWLATAGSGDVLSGFICGLLARGFGVMQAAETAAWLHVQCALKFGPGLIAEDLPELLPRVLRDLGV